MFEPDRLKTIGGFDNTDFGGDMFSYSPTTDTLADILGAGFFNEAFQQLNGGDFIIINRSEGGLSILSVVKSTSEGVTVVEEVTGTPITATIAAPGAIPLTADIVNIESGGLDDAFSLADGTEGQELTLVHTVDGGNAVVTPASALGYTTINLVALGDTAKLQFLGGSWVIMSTTGGVIVT